MRKKKTEENNIETTDTITEEKSTIKNKTTKKKNPVNDLKTLTELCDLLVIDRFDLILKLSETGYLNQYYKEEKMLTDGLVIEPSVSESEFKKLFKEYIK